MSAGILVLTVFIVLAIYVYMRHVTRKRKQSLDEIDTVRYYRENYLQSSGQTKRRLNRRQTGPDNNGYRTYVTKYNSSEDYRERKGL